MKDLMDWESMFDVGAAVAKEKAKRAAKAAKYANSEAKLQKEILAYLAKVGFLVIRINSSVQWTEHGSRLTSYRIVNTNGTSGVADAVIMRDRKVYMVEIKTSKGRLSQSQTAFRDLCHLYNIDYIVMRSLADAETFIDILNATPTPEETYAIKRDGQAEETA